MPQPQRVPAHLTDAAMSTGDFVTNETQNSNHTGHQWKNVVKVLVKGRKVCPRHVTLEPTGPTALLGKQPVENGRTRERFYKNHSQVQA